MTFFLVVTLFCHFCPSVFSYFTLYTPYMHTHMLFSRFSTFLFVLLTVDTAYTIYFVLIHHCTNSLSSLHIFVHYCTFCASLHTKTSPVLYYIDNEMLQVDGRFPCPIGAGLNV